MMEVEKKIPPQKVGTEFLASSHFSIGQEQRWLPNHDPMVYQSTFKKDYPPLPLQKRERVPSPTATGIMHKDTRYTDQVSITRSHFIEKPIPNEKLPDPSYVLRKTNFKMDSDKKLDSFQTTHKEYFPVQPLDAAKSFPPNGKTEWMKSHIPQGWLVIYMCKVFSNCNFKFIRLINQSVNPILIQVYPHVSTCVFLGRPRFL